MATKAPLNRRLAALELAVDELEIGMFRSPSGPGTISGKAIKPKTVTAGLVNVSSLEAVNTKTGSLSVTGGITMTTAGAFSAGQTAYDTGVGFWLEYNAGTPRFSLGNSGGNKLTWNGTTLAITGTITADAGTIGGFSIGATDLTTDAGATGLASSGSQRIWVGNATPSSAPFRVSSTGVATMIGAVIGSAASGARVELNPTNGVSVYDSGGTVRGRLLTTGAGYLGSTDGTSATAALSWTTAGVATINASAITTGTLNASGITVTNLNASSITAGTLVADRISGGSLGGGFSLGGSNITVSGAGVITNSDGDTWGPNGIVLKSAGAYGDSIKWNHGGSDVGSITGSTSGMYMYEGSSASATSHLFLSSTSARLQHGSSSYFLSVTGSGIHTGGPIYPGTTGLTQTSNSLSYVSEGIAIVLGDSGGTYTWDVRNSSGTRVFGVSSNGSLFRAIANDATALGAYYGRVPIYINGALRYLAVYN